MSSFSPMHCISCASSCICFFVSFNCLSYSEILNQLKCSKFSIFCVFLFPHTHTRVRVCVPRSGNFLDRLKRYFFKNWLKRNASSETLRRKKKKKNLKSQSPSTFTAERYYRTFSKTGSKETPVEPASCKGYSTEYQ